MPIVTEHQPGMFSYADLTTSDAAAAKQFYTALFGWEYTDNPVDDQGSGDYTLFSRGGASICGMFQLTPEMAAAGAPTAWNSYVTVANTDETFAKAVELGATPIVPPMDVEPVDMGCLGRMAVVFDTGGAAISIWQPAGHIGADLFGDPGCLIWAELYTHDTDASTRFYTALFGWEHQEVDAGGESYHLFTIDGQPATGMMQIRPEWGEVPPHWAVYFAVEDAAAATARVEELGGQVVAPPQTVEGVGAFAPVFDPQGGFFLLMQPAPELMESA